MSKVSRRSRGSVTIEDVARAAGVSTMTVSRVINNEKNVRDLTRERIHKAIADLRYSPNVAARSLAAGEATHIGLLCSNPSASYLSLFLVGALEGARQAGCHLVIEPCESDDENDRRMAARRFASTQVEGVILPPPMSESEAILGELEAAKLRVVTVAMGDRHPNSLNVRMDDRLAAAEMTQYLIDLGHRRIALITGNQDQIASHHRERGFRDTVAAAGLNPADIIFETGDFTYLSGIRAAERLLDLDRPPTAIFASNDDMAAAVIGVAHRRGMHVPGDLSVAGFDDTSLATTVWPELTTIRQPVSDMSKTALEILLHDLRNHRGMPTETVVDKVLDHELIIRESCASPPGA